LVAEQDDQDRRHQRSATDAGQPDQEADHEAGDRVERLQRGKRGHAETSRRRAAAVRHGIPAMTFP